MSLKLLKEEEGLSPMLREFRSIVDKESINSVVFIGSVGVCQPFAELFYYAIRDKDGYFIPNGDLSKVKKLIVDDSGVSMKKIEEIQNTDAVVLFGGLAMPRYGVDVEKIKNVLNLLSPKCVIGICFMSIFQKSKWDKKINFNYLIDGHIKVKVYAKEK
ncbi:conserved hypothetical protein [Methanocaldococcus vulcanius M7]|uniref:DUF2124 domain-containing protein n=1 Tax=Methanocaldococcus vulcanius (strain ATCC 700851 / DSM 12094 / M7) TaxID=579137 RepID=C9RDI9_METVM|nr:DUF2124 family protein [Methanocaldococcus vulcanius]ACX73368.1 conserved hypothetical protein [Methanocaldococcus vulcanius M7]